MPMPPPKPPRRPEPLVQAPPPPLSPPVASGRKPAVETLFAEILALSSAEERERVLAEGAREDPAIVEEVRALLAAHQEAGDFMREPPVCSPEIEAELARLKPEEAGETIGPYKLREQIGEGGFGTVWVADQDVPVRRRVALKIIKMGMDTKEVIARFEQERQALAMMDHPNIAKVLDAGATKYGRPFFVMELVKGMTITKYCDEAGLTTRERLALFGDVCSAINHAHQKGIIHRDIKPSNVLVTLHGDKAVVKVIDFGIAKATQGRLTDHTVYTQFEQMIGTPAYMSPEQAGMSGLDVDTRSDIYALGILLYELLVGKPPFDGESLMQAGYEEMRRIIREVEPVKPSSRLSTVTDEDRTQLAKSHRIEPEKIGKLVEPDLDWIVMKAIDKDRTRRYETANAFAQDILRFLTDQPVTATPPSAGYQFRKFARRNKAALRVAAAIATVLMAATVVSTWQAVRATRAEKQALAAENQAKAEALRATKAEKLAEEETKRTKAALADAEATSKFMTDMFTSSQPGEKKGGREVKVADVLDIAAKKLETELTGQPERRAVLQDTLGQTYCALGLYPPAIALQEKVRDYCLKTYGLEHPETLGAMNNLASSYYDTGRRDKALKMQEEVLALRRKVSGPEHPATLTAMHNLAVSYSEAGRRGEALNMQEESLALRRKVLGPEHPETLVAMNNLAVSYSEAGRKDGALKMREEVLALRRKALGPEHPETLVAMHNLANSYFEASRREEALKMQEEVLALRRKVSGPEHPDTLGAMNNLAGSYSEAGRRDEALKMKKEVLALRRKVLGPEHPDTLTAMNNLAGSHSEAGRKDEALKMREEVLALRRKALGSEHPETLGAMHNLANSYFEASRREEALKMQEEVLALRLKVSGPEHPETLVAMNNLAVSYSEAGRKDEALKMLEGVLALRGKVIGHEHPETLAALSNLANNLYLGTPRAVEALPLLSEFSTRNPKQTHIAMLVAALQVWFGKDTEHIATSKRMLAWAKDATKPDDLERSAKLACLRPIVDAALRQAALALARKAVELGKGNPGMPYYKMTLGMAEYRAGHFAEAVQTLLINPATIGHVGGTSAFYRAMSLYQQGQKDEARALFTATEATMNALPADEKNPLADKANADDLILWLAYKEAKALLAQPGPPTK